MQIDWSTLALELVNFVVLVWLLRRFLYTPVLNVLHQRRSAIAEKLEHAQHTQQQADQLKQEFAQRVDGWEQQQNQLRQTLEHELQVSESQALEQQEHALSEARERDQARTAHQQEQLQQRLEQQALSLGASFSSQLLSRLACPELEAQLIGLFITDWHALSNDDLKGSQAVLNEGGCVQVCSAYPLTDELRTQLQQAIRAPLGQTAPIEFTVDPRLLAGLALTIGGWHLGANLADELRFFSDAAQSAPMVAHEHKPEPSKQEPSGDGR